MDVPAKRKLTADDHAKILGLNKGGMSVSEIAQYLGLHGQQVAGYVRTVENFAPRPASEIPEASPRFPGRPMLPMPMPGYNYPPPPSEESQLEDLHKLWKTTEPTSQFSLRTAKNGRLSISVYKDGVAISIGDGKKVALLTSAMAIRFGAKLSEMAQWARGWPK